MEPSDEQPREPSPPPAAESARLEAHASGQAHIHQAGRDLHQHYQDDVQSGRRAEPGTATSICPYPGLAAFGHEYAQWFFGRDQLTKALIGRLSQRLRTGGIQAVVSSSGAGKSSLLHAGLLPELAGDALPGSSRWATMVFTPTAQPLGALATRIATFTRADPAAVADTLTADPRQAVAILDAALHDRADGEGSRTQLVVVVDQFEELFTLCTDEQERRAFVELLGQLAGPGPGAGTDARPVGLVVVGIRADFYPACVDYPHLRTAVQDNPVTVGPMSDTQLREAILRPALDVGLDVEPGLVELMLRDLGDPALATGMGMGGIPGNEAGRLPLLAHALRATWQQRHGHILTVHSYQTTGGIHRAVAITAKQVFDALDADSQAAAQTMFLRLVKVGDGTEDTRRRMARTDLLRGLEPRSALPVLEAFTQHRLLTQDRDTVEITHEALLHAWPRLRQWIDTDRAGNLTRQQLEDATTTWDRNRRDTSVLYRGNRLAAAGEWAARHRDDVQLSPRVHEFLAASSHRENSATRLRRTVLIVLSVLALLTSTGAVVAVQQNGIARGERDTALFKWITAEAARLRSTDVSLAAQLDLTAYSMRPENQDVVTALRITQNAVLSTSLTKHTDIVRSVAFSPDRRTLASAGNDETVWLWDLTDPADPRPLGQPLTGHTDRVNAVAFSPQGGILVSGSSDNTVRLWNTADPAHPAPLGEPLTGHTGWVSSVVFSPDGHTLASASADQTVKLWDLTDPAHPRPLGQLPIGYPGTAGSVAFSPDGRTLASPGSDHTVQLWNLTEPNHPSPSAQPFSGHTKSVNSVAFSPNGRVLASTGDDGQVRLWDLTNPTQPGSLGEPLIIGNTSLSTVTFSPDGNTLAYTGSDRIVQLLNLRNPRSPYPLGLPLTGHTNVVWSVAFSPDGRTLASAGADRTVRLWDIPDTFLTGHTGIITSVAFSPDDRTLATGSADQTVRLWDMTAAHPQALGQPLTGHEGNVNSVAFSPDGHTLASASDDKTVRLWDVTNRAHPQALGQPLDQPDLVSSLAFRGDGHTLASGSADDTVWLWDVTDPAHPQALGQPLTGHEGLVWTVAFRPDGNTLASASNDETVRLWDVTDPAHARALGQPLTGDTGGSRRWRSAPTGRRWPASTLTTLCGCGTSGTWPTPPPWATPSPGTPAP